MCTSHNCCESLERHLLSVQCTRVVQALASPERRKNVYTGSELMRKNPITCCGVGIKSQSLGLGDILGEPKLTTLQFIHASFTLLVGFHGKEGEGEVACRLRQGASSRSRLVWRLGVVEFSLPLGFQESEDGRRVEELVVADDSAMRFAGSGGPDNVGRGIEAEEDVL